MPRIECPFCGAFATKVPGRTLAFHKWERAVVDVRKAAFWQLPLTSKLKKLEAERDALRTRIGELWMSLLDACVGTGNAQHIGEWLYAGLPDGLFQHWFVDMTIPSKISEPAYLAPCGTTKNSTSWPLQKKQIPRCEKCIEYVATLPASLRERIE